MTHAAYLWPQVMASMHTEAGVQSALARYTGEGARVMLDVVCVEVGLCLAVLDVVVKLLEECELEYLAAAVVDGQASNASVEVVVARAGALMTAAAAVEATKRRMTSMLE